ncbi:Uncharacterised protein [Campylobacter jejuni subsp. doylei]|uniref:Uncharacterized protein n=1 Tax=Campylobacter jejuni subsp. doylei TaxID=32021 RepID=A0A3S4W253_CAMJU|nr:Uncharacterised protein [Campylobacter jejuni subsp. doylei]
MKNNPYFKEVELNVNVASVNCLKMYQVMSL